jgi:serine O-acetyltransferase
VESSTNKIGRYGEHGQEKMNMHECESRRELRRQINRCFKECLLADMNAVLVHSNRQIAKFSHVKVLLWALHTRGRLAVLLFRLMTRSYRKGHRFRAFILARLSQVLCDVEFGYDCDIGPGLEIAHGGGVVISGKVVAGKKLSIRQGVTIGGNLGKKNANGRRFPILGDNVFICAGACVAGPITIGSNVVVGANAVVTKDVPDNATVAGVPGTVMEVDGRPVHICERPGALGAYLKEIEERLKRVESQLELLKEQGSRDNEEK